MSPELSWECRPAGGDWVPATVPGTAAQLFPDADHDGIDWEWRARITGEPGDWTLALDGVATLAEVRLNGEVLLESESMFQPHRTPVTLTGDDELLITCRALRPVVATKHPRPRWRTRLVEHQHLRWYRTTFLGRMPGWSPGPAPVGPWRPVRLVRGAEPTVAVRGTTVEVHAGGAEVEVAGVRAALVDGHAVVEVPDAARWWPHTHGSPVLHDVRVDGEVVARVGVRSVTFDDGELRVNDVPVFARGACWVPPDVVSLNADPRPVLERVRDAGLNMVRVMGTMVWEDTRFWDACDDLGILVWQDCMFANVDPPDDETWLTTVERELTDQLGALRARPSLAVVCGGSEVEQQAAMVGLAPEARAMPLFETHLPKLLETLQLDVPYVRNSPTSGGNDLPFRTGSGVAHYYGVGAYLRPFGDVRRAGVRFASECLAFSTPPERDASPRTGVPRDNGAPWDFEDVRDHYVRELFGVDPARVRYEDPERYLDLGRAAVVECVEAALSEWRRPSSACGGALVLLLKDLFAGSGWGVLDVDGRPKAPWWALRRLSQPLTLGVTDEGLNGLAVHAVNDSGHVASGVLRVEVYDGAGRVVESGHTTVEVPARGGITLDAESVLGGFRDLTYAYRFGARRYDAVRVTLNDAEVVWLAADRPRLPSIGLTARVDGQPGAWHLDVTTEQAAQRVAIDAGALDPEDSWFHLAPGTTRRVRLIGASDHAPTGEVRALNSIATARLVVA